MQLGSGFISRRFDYVSGDFTETHAENDKLKSSPTTLLVKSISFDDGRTLNYEYDEEERITKITGSGSITEYEYDEQGQLVCEYYNGAIVNAMEYDGYGNITAKNEDVYTYDNAKWKDLLTKVGNQTISYDNQGNPISYLGHTLTWEKGRQLKAFDTNTYTYNANGIRTSKTVNGITHNYILAGTKILRETWGENILVPLYDNEDSACGIEYNGNAFYFVRNLQNDIVAITDKDGETVARYTYDAWGACTVAEDTSEVGIATVNPYRYRSYYYDTEIGMYYLQSRYYDPAVGRFINADNAAYLVADNNSNLFAYCRNNSINNIDATGFLAFSISVIIAAGIVGAIFSAISQIATNFFSGKRGKNIFRGVLGSAVGGAVNSTLLLLLWFVPGSNIIAGFVAGFIQSLIDSLFEVLVYKSLSWRGFLAKCTVNGLLNSAANIAGNLIGGKMVFINNGWFRPQYVRSFLKGSFGHKLIAQTGIGAVINIIVNLIRKFFRI